MIDWDKREELLAHDEALQVRCHKAIEKSNKVIAKMNAMLEAVKAKYPPVSIGVWKKAKPNHHLETLNLNETKQLLINSLNQITAFKNKSLIES